ncbi:MAG TPA: bifunctional (p)ppGpp synthetase/guanosine-3',5'-bis(diphosphate) 3'-pyrophosphohydrolase [Patescibacteria group bacterium]|nr:bifunctional (p)ppGpp synthetase/guanosine-3',5'-bis(diphosphate) 3'-pyrophosphohydrolase [Patescibacteria group bacterium]
MTGQAELIQQVKSYNPDVDTGAINAAVDYAVKMHDGQKRASGEPYYTHPVEVACILADMRMDIATIQTAILHDTLEDTKATPEEIKAKFGDEVLMLINGVSKLTRIESQTVEGKQAENFRKLVLAMSEDIRILLVKLADRLHNMRTLHHFNNEDKKRRIARETLEIYAPLAERIGLHKIKEELEDLAFGHLNPEAREGISNRLSFLRTEGSEIVRNIIKELKSALKKAGVEADVTGREKTRYSIWRKMQRKNVAFEQLSDLMAFRVVVESVEQCYHALGIIHGDYPTVPGRFKDYISTPKPNGYRSVHTTVIGPEKHRIEVQIRTRQMHEEADLGVAAHWAYKEGGSRADMKDVKKYRWLRELLDIIENEQKPEEFLENTKMELFQDQVYVFSPKGDLIELPNGATPIDFAYAIHSALGDKCVGAKINGRIAPLNTKLSNGDSVEVITAKNQNPSPTWERFVVTGKARSHIRRFIRQQQRGEYVTLGKAMLQKLYQQEGYEFAEKGVMNIIPQFRAENIEDVYAGIGSGNIVARDVFKAIFPAHKTETAKKPTDAEAEQRQQVATARGPSGAPLPIKGLIPGMAVHFARCCHPLPGDRIVGIVTHGKGVTIHTIDCDTLENFADTPERWLDVSWGDGADAPEAHVGRLEVVITNTPGALGTLSTVIGKNGGNITNLKIASRSLDFWDMTIDVYVNDTKHLNNIIAALRATPQVSSVDRSRGR